MISFMILVVPPEMDWTRLSPPEPTIVPESSELVLSPVKAGPVWSERAIVLGKGRISSSDHLKRFCYSDSCICIEERRT